MQVTDAIRILCAYSSDCGIIEPQDTRWAYNTLLRTVGSDGRNAQSTPNITTPTEERVEQALEALAHELEMDVDDAACLLFGAIMPRPSEMGRHFTELLEISPRTATDWFYELSCDARYVRRTAIARNIGWKSPTRWGELELTVNLSKPEKDPRDIARSALASSTDAYPACQLCQENEGYIGRSAASKYGQHPNRCNLRIVPFLLGGQPWGLQYSPYAYFNEHCILMSEEHRMMRIDDGCIDRLLEAVTLLPHYFVGSNADLPIVGGSILSHDHFQGGDHEFPMDRARVETPFELPGVEGIDAGFLRWPVSVIRLTSKDTAALAAGARRIISAWSAYDDPSAGIVSHTGETPHNTVTPIARWRDGRFELDIALRCNITSPERPLGVFHPRPELHHIKRENIGLIEVMGLAILPPRLKRELDVLTDLLANGEDPANDPVAAIHAPWAHGIIERHGTGTASELKPIIRQEIGEVFAQVLEDAGVFKWNDEGLDAQMRFVDRLINS